MDASEITTWIADNLPETLLLIGGILAMVIAITYVKDKDSGKYKLMTALGFIFGVVMAFEAMSFYGQWQMVTSIIISLAAFTLIIRPFREVHFAIILALLVMALVYIAMGGLAGVMLFDSIDLTFLSEGWPRIIVAFLAGAVIYMVFNFAEAIVKLFGKILNWWPLLLLLGLFCIAEGACMLMGYGSITDYFNQV